MSSSNSNTLGVSPVLAVALLLFITVLLSASVGSFVISSVNENAQPQSGTSELKIVQDGTNMYVEVSSGNIQKIITYVNGEKTGEFIDLTPGSRTQIPEANATSRIDIVQVTGDQKSVILTKQESSKITDPGETLNNNPSPQPNQLTINKATEFTVTPTDNTFTLSQVQVQDTGQNTELNTINYQITDSTGTIVYNDTIQTTGQQYQTQSLTLPSPANLQNNEQYTLTLTATNTNNQTTSTTRTTSTTPTGQPPVINTLQGFSIDTQSNTASISQIQVQDNGPNRGLNTINYQITDSTGTIVYNDTIQTTGQQYQTQSLGLSSTANLQNNEQYTLTLTVTDIENQTTTTTTTTEANNGNTQTTGDITVAQGEQTNNINTDGKVTLEQGATSGNITATDDITLKQNAQAGNIDTQGAITLEKGSTSGDITTTDDITLKQNAQTGMINTDGAITLEKGSTSGDITTTDDITLKQNAQTGTIDTEGDVTLEQGSTAFNIVTTGDVTLKRNAQAGNIETTGEVKLEQGATSGDITTTGDVTLKRNAQAGTIDADGEVKLERGANAANY